MPSKPVVVVTGGAIGIGAGIAEAFGRHGAFVVTMDPVVALDGSPQSGGAEQTTAERIVAALTWQIGHAAPPGVTVNALSPIAATRMVANALSRQAGEGNSSGKSAASGGVALTAAPPPEHLGPIGAYLASDEFAWCT